MIYYANSRLNILVPLRKQHEQSKSLLRPNRHILRIIYLTPQIHYEDCGILNNKYVIKTNKRNRDINALHFHNCDLI